jgi:pyrimidine operon attenuation protein/uracil phosphoribosyltransferase
MEDSRKKILSHSEIKAKVERIAHQIHESYFSEKEIVLIGIQGRGFDFAKRLLKILDSICELEIHLDEISLDKDSPLERPIVLEKEIDLKGKHVLLVDDVLNSGKTMAYAVGHLLRSAPKTLKTVILVNREHHRYPITADFVGLSLATTLKEHISVELGRSDGVYLV